MIKETHKPITSYSWPAKTPNLPILQMKDADYLLDRFMVVTCCLTINWSGDLRSSCIIFLEAILSWRNALLQIGFKVFLYIMLLPVMVLNIEDHLFFGMRHSWMANINVLFLMWLLKIEISVCILNSKFDSYNWS